MGRKKERLVAKSELIPSWFKLTITDWSVLIFPSLEDDNLGECDATENQIRLAEESDEHILVLEKRNETFFHELVHAVLYEMEHNMTNNETFVQTMGALLYQFIKSTGLTKLNEFVIPETFSLFAMQWKVLVYTKEEQKKLDNDIPLDFIGGSRETLGELWYVKQTTEYKDAGVFMSVLVRTILKAFDHPYYKNRQFCAIFSRLLLQAFKTAVYA